MALERLLEAPKRQVSMLQKSGRAQTGETPNIALVEVHSCDAVTEELAADKFFVQQSRTRFFPFSAKWSLHSGVLGLLVVLCVAVSAPPAFAAVLRQVRDSHSSQGHGSRHDALLHVAQSGLQAKVFAGEQIQTWSRVVTRGALSGKFLEVLQRSLVQSEAEQPDEGKQRWQARAKQAFRGGKSVACQGVGGSRTSSVPCQLPVHGMGKRRWQKGLGKVGLPRVAPAAAGGQHSVDAGKVSPAGMQFDQ